jgi:hypothetical protein
MTTGRQTEQDTSLRGTKQSSAPYIFWIASFLAMTASADGKRRRHVDTAHNTRYKFAIINIMLSRELPKPQSFQTNNTTNHK